MKFNELRNCRAAIEFEKTEGEDFARFSARGYTDGEFLVVTIGDEVRNFSFDEAAELHAFLGAAIEMRNEVREEES